jgi:imidazole glycerol-phosphate synthase subunit HisF
MFIPRVIPVLLLRNMGIVKSVQFKNHRYIGDPINAVRIFNDLKADELSFMDILASKEKRCISLDFVKKVGDEANMPFGVGGGIRNLHDIEMILKAGAEKVIINTFATKNPEFIKEASSEFGSSTIVVSIDVKKSILGKYQVYILSGSMVTKYNVIEFAKLIEEMGAGELLLNSIDRDGMMSGFDLDLIKSVSEVVRIPVVAMGGAGKYEDLAKAINLGYASAVAAGSLFVFHGTRKAVLINYPTREELKSIFSVETVL